MFTFGILSSHLPYVAFAAFYLFYLFFPSQFKQLDDEPIKIDDQKIISIQILQQETQTQQTENYQFQVITENQDCSNDISPKYHSIIKIPILNNNQGPRTRYFSPLFSRPPPSV